MSEEVQNSIYSWEWNGRRQELEEILHKAATGLIKHMGASRYYKTKDGITVIVNVEN
ncbi:MAG: hypothetical protein V4563_17510 [Pseudomonadota bacterium]